VRFSSPEQYLEKIGGLGDVLKSVSGAGKSAITTGSRSGVTIGLGETLLNAIKTNPLTSTLAIGGLVGLGGLGGFKAMEGGQPGDTYSYRINKSLNSLLDRIRYDEVAGESFAKQLGSQSAESLMGLATDMASKTVDTIKSVTMDSPARNAIFSALRKEDPIIAQADMKTLNDAFHTMANVAPSLSTDKNAVKSVLRLAATSGGGLDYQTIKGLADAETSLKKARGEMR